MITLQKSLVIILIVLLCGTGMCAANILEDALVGAWLFDENRGVTAEDASGNGHDGDIQGAKWVQGKIGTALEFDGDGNIVEIAHHVDFDLTEYTISAWIKTEPTGLWQTVIGKEPVAGNPRNYGIFVAGNTKLLGVNYTTAGAWKTAFQQDSRCRWQMASRRSATFDGTFLRAYFDGVMEGETKTEIPPDHNTEPVRIGRWGNPRGDYWSGRAG